MQQDERLGAFAGPVPLPASPGSSAPAGVLTEPGPPPGACRFLDFGDGSAACLAIAPATHLSSRQTQLVCLGPAHVDCPRFTHGGLGERPTPLPARRSPAAAEAVAVAGAAVAGTAAGTPGDIAAGADARISAVASGGIAAAESGGIAAGATDTHLTSAGSRPSDEAATASDPPTGARFQSGAARSVHEGTAAESSRRTRRGPFGPAQAHERTVVLRPATAAASLTLLGAIVVAILFVAARGGLSLAPASSPSATSAIAGIASASPAASADARSSLAVSPPPEPTPGSTPAPSPVDSASGGSLPPASGGSLPPASAGASPPASFSPDQLAQLQPCPGRPDCYQYRIKSGDNLHGIATSFGVQYASLLKANPQITTPSIIHVGEVIVLPAPGT